MGKSQKVKKSEEMELENSGGEVSESGELEMEADAKGNTFLPGSAPVVIKALVDQVINIETYLKPSFGQARDALVAAKDNLSRLAHEHIEHFSKPDENGARFYKAGGVVVEITFEKEKINGKIEKAD